MAYSYGIVVSDGTTDNFVVPFPYIDKTHVHVKLDGVLVDDALLTWVSGTILQLPSTPANGVAVKIYRETPVASLATVYSTPTVLDHRDWNRVLTQLQYVCQEAFDLGEISGEFVADVTDFVNAALTGTAANAAAAAASASTAATHETNAETAETNAAASAAAAAAAVASISTHMLGSNNLSEIVDDAVARTNIGLGDSATKNVGTTAGTVAAGDDSRLALATSLDTAALKKGTTGLITVGYTVTPEAKGNMGSAWTPDPALGNYKTATNNAAVTITAPTADCAIDILITNSATAGAVSFSGFTVSADVGDAYVTTNTYKFLLCIRRVGGTSTYIWKALQ